MLLRSLHLQKSDLLVNIKNGLDHEILLFVDEALSELLELDEARCGLVKHFNIFTS